MKNSTGKAKISMLGLILCLVLGAVIVVWMQQRSVPKEQSSQTEVQAQNNQGLAQRDDTEEAEGTSRRTEKEDTKGMSKSTKDIPPDMGKALALDSTENTLTGGEKKESGDKTQTPQPERQVATFPHPKMPVKSKEGETKKVSFSEVILPEKQDMKPQENGNEQSESSITEERPKEPHVAQAEKPKKAVDIEAEAVMLAQRQREQERIRLQKVKEVFRLRMKAMEHLDSH